MIETITITAVGDIFLGAGVEELITAKGSDYVFDLIIPFIQGSDIVIGNLESPVSNHKIDNSSVEYLAPKPSSLDGLKNAGFNAVSLANNHTMDFGTSGLQDTITALEERKIGYVGAGIDEKSARQQLKIAGNPNVTLLAYYGKTMGTLDNKSQGYTNGAQVSQILADIQKARSENDLVVVALHWGGYCRKLPQKYQVDFAHQMIDSGAKVVIGSGPHTLQPVELYHGGVIAYSLGNFVFDHTVFDPPKPETRPSMILEITLTKNNVENVTIQPICINDDYRPEPINIEQDPILSEAILSLLVDKLDIFESDSQTVLTILTRNKLNPITIIKKIFFPSQRAHNLSFYCHSFMKLIKEKLS